MGAYDCDCYNDLIERIMENNIQNEHRNRSSKEINDNITQAPTVKKKYHCFYVSGRRNPKDTSAAINTQLNALNDRGWIVEKIDCHDNPCGGWDSDKRCYYMTKDYIILAYTEAQND